jgi:hypothetical protein
MIVTGAAGSKAFSAGADLKEWLELYVPVVYTPKSLLLSPSFCCLVGIRRFCRLVLLSTDPVLILERGRAWMARVWDS